MNMPETLMCSRCRVQLYPVEAPRAIVYAAAEQDTAQALRTMLPADVALAALDRTDWNRDFSPWPAPAVFRDGDFAGGAPQLLHALQTEVLPAVNARYPGAPQVIAGYSLAGLFAVWATMQTDVFAGAVSASGSLWFDGFTDYAAQARCYASCVYLSVGDREKRTRNPRMQRVEDAILRVQALLEEQGVTTTFELNPGNHFQQTTERLARGIAWAIAALQG